MGHILTFTVKMSSLSARAPIGASEIPISVRSLPTCNLDEDLNGIDHGVCSLRRCTFWTIKCRLHFAKVHTFPDDCNTLPISVLEEAVTGAESREQLLAVVSL